MLQNSRRFIRAIGSVNFSSELNAYIKKFQEKIKANIPRVAKAGLARSNIICQKNDLIIAPVGEF